MVGGTGIKIGTEDAVPGKVIACFRPRRAFQAIRDERMEAFSNYLYHKGDGGYKISLDVSKTSFFDLINYQDCEDIVGLYLQYKHNYMIVPSSCKSDTIATEFILKHRETGDTALVQVKQGKVNLSFDGANLDGVKVMFVLSTEGQVHSTSDKISVLDSREMETFCLEHQHLMPERVLMWLKFLSDVR